MEIGFGITGLKTGVTTQDIKTQLSNQLKLAESSKIPIGKLTEDSYKKFIHLLSQMGKRQMVLRLYVDGIVL